MIIKRGQIVEGLEKFVRQNRFVMARQMNERFQVETLKDPGWEYGRPGDWLVHIGGELWSAISNNEFSKIYRRARETDCIGPCDDFMPERRAGPEDRRATA